MRLTFQDQLARDGFALVRSALAAEQIATLCRAFDDTPIAGSTRAGVLFGARNLLEIQAVRDIADAPAIAALVRPVLGPAATPRATLFDKTPAANWPVLWHQDVAVAMAERHDLEGWGPWSVKAGVQHAHAPAHILEAMLAVRLHLDDCGEDNGPLRVLPGTHTRGRLSRDQIRDADVPEVACVASAGDALLIRPLLLHASGTAHAPSRRRVLHLEFAAGIGLPEPLRWAAASIRKEFA